MTTILDILKENLIGKSIDVYVFLTNDCNKMHSLTDINNTSKETLKLKVVDVLITNYSNGEVDYQCVFENNETAFIPNF